jgi:DNA polymerase I-like protein with 3'-5' exonuclease and polymerase domains
MFVPLRPGSSLSYSSASTHVLLKIWSKSLQNDELIFDSPRELAEHYKTLIKAGMEDSFRTLFGELPIEVEAKIVNNWGEK